MIILKASWIHGSLLCLLIDTYSVSRSMGLVFRPYFTMFCTGRVAGSLPLNSICRRTSLLHVCPNGIRTPLPGRTCQNITVTSAIPLLKVICYLHLGPTPVNFPVNHPSGVRKLLPRDPRPPPTPRERGFAEANDSRLVLAAR